MGEQKSTSKQTYTQINTKSVKHYHCTRKREEHVFDFREFCYNKRQIPMRDLFPRVFFICSSVEQKNNDKNNQNNDHQGEGSITKHILISIPENIN